MTLALSARPGNEGACRLLALVGPPGSAKSTMVRLLAQDMDVELAEWQVGFAAVGFTRLKGVVRAPARARERKRHIVPEERLRLSLERSKRYVGCIAGM